MKLLYFMTLENTIVKAKEKKKGFLGRFKACKNTNVCPVQSYVSIELPHVAHLRSSLPRQQSTIITTH
jgi:hypothetical protein